MSEPAPSGKQPPNRAMMSGSHTLLRARRVAAEALPHPDKTWAKADIPPALEETLNKFHQKGIIEIVEQAQQDSYRYNIYRTAPAAYEYVQLLPDPPSSCGHTGIRNLGAGRFTCTNDQCDVEFGREEAWNAIK